MSKLLTWFRKFLTPKAYPKCVFPMPILSPNRTAQVTSRGRWANSSRPTHNGDDWMYKRDPSDTEGKGDGAGTSNGKWNVPDNTPCLAIRDGIVRESSFGKIGTGFRLYVQHEDGFRSGYFHLLEIYVQPGEIVKAGTALGRVGDNPKVTDPRHLHFEVSEGVDYAPVDPWEYLKKHGAQHAKPRGE